MGLIHCGRIEAFFKCRGCRFYIYEHRYFHFRRLDDIDKMIIKMINKFSRYGYIRKRFNRTILAIHPKRQTRLIIIFSKNESGTLTIDFKGCLKNFPRGMEEFTSPVGCNGYSYIDNLEKERRWVVGME